MRNASPINRISSRMPGIVRPPESASEIPRNMRRPPRVATKAGIPRRETQRPFQTPTRAPMASATTIVTPVGMLPAYSRSAITVAERPSSEPTDRSISPWAMTTNMPRATTAVTEVCRMRLTMFRSLRNTPSVVAKKISQMIAMASIRPGAERAWARKLWANKRPRAVRSAAAASVDGS